MRQVGQHLRTRQWTYTGSPEGLRLYYNVGDLYQMNNLAEHPAHAEMMNGLDAPIQAWMKST